MAYLGPLQPVKPRRPPGCEREMATVRGPGLYVARSSFDSPSKAHSFGKSKRSQRAGFYGSKQFVAEGRPSTASVSTYVPHRNLGSSFLKQSESRTPSAPTAVFPESPRFPSPRKDVRPHAYTGHSPTTDIWATPTRGSTSGTRSRGMGGTARRPPIVRPPSHSVGPGSYTPEVKATKKQGGSVSIGKGTRDAATKAAGMRCQLFMNSDFSPGPNAYTVKMYEIGQSGPSASFGDRPLHPSDTPAGQTRAAEPGPGTFNPQEKFGATARAVSFTTEDRLRRFPKSAADRVKATADVPGPGTFVPSRPSTAPKFSFGTSTRKAHSYLKTTAGRRAR